MHHQRLEEEKEEVKEVVGRSFSFASLVSSCGLCTACERETTPDPAAAEKASTSANSAHKSSADSKKPKPNRAKPTMDSAGEGRQEVLHRPAEPVGTFDLLRVDT